jgi:hypothetical protein
MNGRFSWQKACGAALALLASCTPHGLSSASSIDSGEAYVGDSGEAYVEHAGTAGAGDAEAVISELNGSTAWILAKQSAACLDCARTNGCLDPVQLGSTCERLTNDAGKPRLDHKGDLTEVQMCKKTLADIFASGCAAATLSLGPCICGDAAVPSCLAGSAPPNGATFRNYVDDFGTTNIATIQQRLQDQSYGAGTANQIVACLAQNACDCFKVATGSRGR